MRRLKQFSPIARAVGVISAVAVLATSVTFTALQTQATLTNNSVSTATAGLQVSTNGTSFGASRTGFDFNDVVPGGIAKPDPAHVFYLRNNGEVNLSLKLSVSSTPENNDSVDLSKVYIRLARDGGASQDFVLSGLVTGNPAAGAAMTDLLNEGADGTYRIQAYMLADAFSGTNADIDDIDLVFYGTGVE